MGEVALRCSRRLLMVWVGTFLGSVRSRKARISSRGLARVLPNLATSTRLVGTCALIEVVSRVMMFLPSARLVAR